MADECIRCEFRTGGICRNSESPFYMEKVDYEKACDMFDPVNPQREIFKQCDLLVQRRDRWQVSADRMVRDTKAIRETQRLFREYYQLNLTKEQEEEITKLRDFLDYLAFSYYWSAAENHKEFEDLWNKNKPFVFS